MRGTMLLLQAVLLLAAGMLLLQPVRRLLLYCGMGRSNYAGEPVVTSSGWIAWGLLTLYLASSGLLQAALPFDGSVLWICCTAVMLFGWADDRYGDRVGAKGFKGHWLSLWREGRPTTGILKAIGTALAALGVLSGQGDVWWGIMPQVLLLLLFTNTVNLLDLRPGRALKSVLLLALLLLLAAGGAALSLLLPLLCAAAVLLPADLRAEMMLGDTGANLLGFGLGFAYVTAAPVWLQWGMLLLLLALHAAAENISLSTLIESNKLLRRIDRWGQSKI